MLTFTRKESDRRLLRRFYRPWYRRPLPWLALLLPLAVAARVALTPLAEREIRRALAEVQDYNVQFTSVDLYLSPPTMSVRNVAVYRPNAGLSPALTADRVDIFFASWKEVFNPDHKISARVVRPRLVAAAEPLELTALLQALPAARIDILAVDDGQVVVPSADPEGVAWLQAVVAQVGGLVTHRSLTADDARVAIEGTATLLGSGRVSFTFTGEPWLAEPNVRGNLSVDRLQAGGVVCNLAGSLAVRDGKVSGAIQGRSTNRPLGFDPTAALVQAGATLAPVAPGVGLVLGEHEPAATAARVGGQVTPSRLPTVDILMGLSRAVVLDGLTLALPIETQSETFAAAD